MAETPRSASLRVVYPRDLRWSHRFSAEPVTLGRQPDDGSPPLHHATVSRRHAQVWWDVLGHHAVRDAGSRHGTLLGPDLVGQTSRVLADGDLLRLGDVLVIYEQPGDEDGDAVDRERLPGASPAMARLRAQVARAAADPSPLLLTGDPGTGKETVARELHRLSGRPGPLVVIDGATSDAAGLARAADGGTLFLDELGALPAELQPALVRVVQDGAVRVIAATSRDLAAAVEAGELSRDLLAGLGTTTLRVPRLSERRGDLLDWVDRLWRGWHERREDTYPPLHFTPAAAQVLLAAPWPDNLRGLDRLVHELAGAGVVTVDVEDLPAWLRPGPAIPPAAAALGLTMLSTGPRPTVPGTSAAIAAASGGVARPPVPTKDEFVAVWTQLKGSVRAVARHFGRDRRQIYRWLETHGLRVPETDDE